MHNVWSFAIKTSGCNKEVAALQSEYHTYTGSTITPSDEIVPIIYWYLQIIMPYPWLGTGISQLYYFYL